MGRGNIRLLQVINIAATLYTYVTIYVGIFQDFLYSSYELPVAIKNKKYNLSSCN